MAIGNSGQVLSRQDYTPWGETRSGDIPQTTLDFTGQRKDDTGLLFYNARYYDPKLGRFLNADSVGVNRGDPQSRNRYSYTLNNPLKYTDPSGHSAQGATRETITGLSATGTMKAVRMGNILDDPTGGSSDPSCLGEASGACASLAEYLQAYYGFFFYNLGSWMLWELELVRTAANALMIAAGWGFEEFRAAMGGFVGFDRVHQPDDGAGHAAWQVGTDITLYDSVFSDRSSAGTLFALRSIVHELAHRWDTASGYQLSSGLVETTGGTQYGCGLEFAGIACWGGYDVGDSGNRASDYGSGNKLGLTQLNVGSNRNHA